MDPGVDNGDFPSEGEVLKCCSHKLPCSEH